MDFPGKKFGQTNIFLNVFTMTIDEKYVKKNIIKFDLWLVLRESSNNFYIEVFFNSSHGRNVSTTFLPSPPHHFFSLPWDLEATLLDLCRATASTTASATAATFEWKESVTDS